MKGITIENWSLIARYLNEEATETDLAQLSPLLGADSRLSQAIQEMKTQLYPSDNFNSDTAFEKLERRFKNENLISRTN